MKVGRCIAIAPAGAFADSPLRGAVFVPLSEIPHDEVPDAAEGRLHGSVLLGHLEAAQAGQPGFFHEAWWLVLFPGLAISILLISLNNYGKRLS